MEELQNLIHTSFEQLAEARDPEIINALKILIAEAQAKLDEVTREH
jgi:hypothetical protein